MRDGTNGGTLGQQKRNFRLIYVFSILSGATCIIVTFDVPDISDAESLCFPNLGVV